MLSGSNLYGLTSALPGTLSTPIGLTGITAGDTLVDIDVRPQNGMLYGLGFNSGDGTVRLYVISPISGLANAVGTSGSFVDAGGGPQPVSGTQIAMDFNPAVDRLRVVTDSGQNFRMNPNTGSFIDGDLGGASGSVAGLNMDGAVNGGTTIVVAAAYTNSQPNVTVTTLYSLDPTSNSLFIQNPPNAGTQTTGQPVTLGGASLDFSNKVGFDIAPGVNVSTSSAVASGIGYATLAVGGTTGLYTIDLTTAAATFLGTIPSVDSLAVWQPLPVGTMLSADGNSLTRFALDTPGTTTNASITGITTGETLVGIDGRPASGQLIGLGINALNNNGTLYRLDPQNGAATAIGTSGGIAFVDSGGNPIDFPDPAGSGYGVDINPQVDRLRVTTETGLNFRVNPISGAPIDGDLGAAVGSVTGVNTDVPLAFGANPIGIAGAAYTNNYSGASATTLYTIDSASNALFIQAQPNNGVQSGLLPLTLGGVPLNITGAVGFDIPPGASTATSGFATSGSGYAALTIGGDSGLYRIDLATGAVTSLGTIGSGTAAIGGFVAWSEPMRSTLTTSTLTVSEGTAVPLIASYATGGGSATAGADYTAMSGTVLLTSGSQTFNVPIIDDTASEPDETFDVVLSGPGIAQTATLTIRSNDPLVALIAATYSGSEIRGTALVTVTLNQADVMTATVAYATADGTARAGSDYTATSGTLTFAPGQTSKTISIAVLPDQVIDAGETFSVNLSAPSVAALGTPASAVVTISDDRPIYQVYVPIAQSESESAEPMSAATQRRVWR